MHYTISYIRRVSEFCSQLDLGLDRVRLHLRPVHLFPTAARQDCLLDPSIWFWVTSSEILLHTFCQARRNGVLWRMRYPVSIVLGVSWCMGDWMIRRKTYSDDLSIYEYDVSEAPIPFQAIVEVVRPT